MFKSLALILSLLLLSDLTARAQCLDRNNERARIGSGFYNNGKLSVRVIQWRIAEEAKPSRFDPDDLDLDRPLTAMPDSTTVTIQSNAPGFDGHFVIRINEEFNLEDTKLCPGSALSMFCEVVHDGGGSPRAPFICEFSEGAP